MPWLHRLACLRDDVIFFVYLYQRWIYPEDKRRRNEFGQIGKDDDSNQLDPGQKISGDEVEINHENTSIATAISDDSKLRKRAANKRK